MAKDIKKEILGKINKGEVKIKPKRWFHFIKFGVAFLIVILALSAVVFANYFVYIPKKMGAFRGSGMGAYTSYMPFVLLVIIILMILISVWLYKEFEGGYKKSFVFIFLVSLVAIIIIGAVLAFSGVNEKLERNPQMRKFHDWQQDNFGGGRQNRQNQFYR
jgi:glucan phosphoethanolaminetransferase (alkaline phosphatase superfamily)